MRDTWPWLLPTGGFCLCFYGLVWLSAPPPPAPAHPVPHSERIVRPTPPCSEDRAQDHQIWLLAPSDIRSRPPRIGALGPPRFPDNYPSYEQEADLSYSLQEMVAPGLVQRIDCREYPCVVYFDGAPEWPPLLAGLRARGLGAGGTASVRAHPTQALVVASDGGRHGLAAVSLRTRRRVAQALGWHRPGEGRDALAGL